MAGTSEGLGNLARKKGAEKEITGESNIHYGSSRVNATRQLETNPFTVKALKCQAVGCNINCDRLQLTDILSVLESLPWWMPAKLNYCEYYL